MSGPVSGNPAVQRLVTCLRAGRRLGICSCTICTVTLMWKIWGWEEPTVPRPWRDIRNPRTKEVKST